MSEGLASEDALTEPAVRLRRHVGDIMAPEKRSAVMSRIRGRDTGPERAMAEEMLRRRLRFEVQAKDLPGRPDFVFRKAHVAVFVDGDFWHGWRFPAWRDKLSEKWEAKIEANRRRDQRNFRKLRRQGWKVLRIWEHNLKVDVRGCVERVVALVRPVRENRSARHDGPGPEPRTG
jgi:DNA mismatch endonuclease (patch repair protein)